MKAWLKNDENNEECLCCKHFWWCEDCNDYHCDIALYGGVDAECEHDKGITDETDNTKVKAD